MDDRSGQQFGEYRLIRLIGRGGFSEVYLGQDIRTRSQVAIKIFNQPLLSSNDVANFINELRSLLRLKHPHILQILDLGVKDDLSFLVMEYAPNGTLADRHRKGTIVSLETILSYVKQIASALQYAHDQRIIHRDVKPQNMLISSNYEILLSDFGTATSASASGNQQSEVLAIGTISYMAPEQIQGKAQLASDQYALGVTVYQWLCGEVPYAGQMHEIFSQHMYATPPSIRSKVPTISPVVEAVVLKALSKEPGERYARIIDFADALEQAISPTFGKSSNIPEDSPELSSDSDEYASRSADALPPLNLEDDSFERQEVPDQFVTSPNRIAVPAPDANAQPGEITVHSSDWQKEVLQQPGNPTLEFPPTIQATPPASSTLLFTQIAPSQHDLKDFFIIYAKADRKWAKWVAWELEEAKYSIVLPPWYLHLQSNLDMEMAKAEAKARRIILILSPDSLKILRFQPMYVTMLQKELMNKQNKLLSICVRDCGSEHDQLLDSLHHIDIVGEDELMARAMLLASVQDTGITLTMHPAFPDTTTRRSLSTEPAFPPDSLTMAQRQVSEDISINTMVPPTLPLSLPNIEIFFSYSHQDKKLRNELEKFMSHLKRHPSIKSWHDGEIGAGMPWAQEIDTHLNKSNIILLLVSQDYIASEYCYDIELQRAIQRHEAGEARVIPIILSPAFWEITPIGRLQALPTEAKPITEWPNRNRNRAWMDVVRGIQRAIEQLASQI